MGVTPQQLAKILNRSKDLCNENGDKLINSKSSGIKSQFVDVDPNTYSDEWDNFSLSNTTEKPQHSPQYTEQAFENSHMPNAILESIKQNPIQQNAADAGIEAAFQMLPKQQKQSITLTENGKQQSIPYQPQPMVSIDYNYLKHIISESISEYFEKKPLNESVGLKQIGLSNGKIKLVDHQGNIFSAQLEFEGNIKDRKKK